VKRVEVAVARVAGKRCRWLLASGRFGRATSCASPVYSTARGIARWKRSAPAAAARGTYRVLSRAVPGEASPTVRTFRVK
jgi:hypothetical protein